MKIIAVLGMTETRLIGSKNGLPWHLPEDMKHFREITKGGVVLMGKNTYLSLPDAFRPLPGRRNIVLTRESIEGVECFATIDAALGFLKTEGTQDIFVIGGAQIYNAFFTQRLVDRVELTLIDGEFEGDIHVEEFRQGFHEVRREKREGLSFIVLER